MLPIETVVLCESWLVAEDHALACLPPTVQRLSLFGDTSRSANLPNSCDRPVRALPLAADLLPLLRDLLPLSRDVLILLRDVLPRLRDLRPRSRDCAACRERRCARRSAPCLSGKADWLS